MTNTKTNTNTNKKTSTKTHTNRNTKGWLCTSAVPLEFYLTLTGGRDGDSRKIQIQIQLQIQMGVSAPQRCDLNFTLAQLVAKMLTQSEPAKTITIRIENPDCGFTL